MSSISYIIPCYNASNTIVRCLDSIRIGGGDDFEIIVVDDCSKDNTVEILQNYHDNIEPRLIIIKNASNIGAGGSRNVGVSMSTKDYIAFVDSDDTIDRRYFSVLSPILHEEADAVIFNAYRVIKGVSSVASCLFSRNTKEGYIGQRDALVYSKGGIWGKIYRRDIIQSNNVKFATIPRNEDLVFTKIAMSFCERVYHSEAAL